MKIEYLYINGFKNLSEFEVSFEKGTTLIAIAGKNGSGKSNVLEAIAEIFTAVMTEGDEPNFTFTVRYMIHGDSVTISNQSGSWKITKNDRVVPKSQRRTILPLTLFLYYAGETARIKNISESAIDKAFSRCITRGITPSYKSISYLSTKDFGLSLLVNRCFSLNISQTLERVLGIEEIAKKCTIVLKRPSWGKRKTPESFWNAKGYLADVLGFLTGKGTYTVISLEESHINLADCEALRDDAKGPEWLFETLKILMQAGILDHIQIDVIKDGQSFDCNDLSEGEKQFGNLISVLNITRAYNALFLLDEFDSHLHPVWQRDFSELINEEHITGQVLFTTHSSLTLGQKRNNSVFLMNGGQIFQSSVDTYNRDVSEILQELMEVSLRPRHINVLITNFNRAIAQKKPEVAKQCRDELAQHLSKNDPFFITADLSIARIE